jgi:hypothetical protein
VLDYAEAAFRREDIETVELLGILRAATTENAVQKEMIAGRIQYYSRLLGQPIPDGGVK